MTWSQCQPRLRWILKFGLRFRVILTETSYNHPPTADPRTVNIHVICEPIIAPHVHIATCRATDNTFMAFLVLHGHFLKMVWNPNLLAGDPKQTRAAAMLSLLESTEDRIREMLLKNSKTGKKITKDNKHCHKNSSHKGEGGRIIPPQCASGTFPEKKSL